MEMFIGCIGVVGLILAFVDSEGLRIFGIGLLMATIFIGMSTFVFKTDAQKKFAITKQFVIANKAQFMQHGEYKRDSLYKTKSFDELKDFEEYYYSILKEIE